MRKSWKIWINYGLGPLLFLILSVSLYRQIIRQPNLSERWSEIQASWQSPGMLVILLLMLVNWGLEARKWQLLVNRLEPFSGWRAFQSVLSGCSVTMLTPNRIGEYGGRVLYLQDTNRLAAVSLTIVGSISQLLVTLGMGVFALAYLAIFNNSHEVAVHILPALWSDALLVLTLGMTTLLAAFYFRIGWLVNLLERKPKMERWLKHLRVLEGLENRFLLRLLGLSILRYLVFIGQYLWMLNLLQIELPLALGFWLLALFYLVMAVAPTFGFVELPVRISASWLIFSFTGNELGVGAAALGIWLINLVIPAVLGSLFMLGIRIWKNEKQGTRP